MYVCICHAITTAEAHLLADKYSTIGAALAAGTLTGGCYKCSKQLKEIIDYEKQQRNKGTSTS